MPLDSNFLKAVRSVDRNWSMGVELVSPLLYSLIRLARPRSVLEVGAGYSTLFILQALADNLEDFKTSRKKLAGHVRSDRHKGLRRLLKGRHPNPLAVPEYYETPYRPLLSVIDDTSHPATSATKVEEVARELRLNSFLKFHEGDFRGMASRFGEESLPLDLIWFDCGMLREFLAEYWDLLNPRGGLLLIHTLPSNRTKFAALKEFREKLVQSGSAPFETLSLLEPHKWRQNSVTLIRKMSPGMDAPQVEEGEAEE